MRTDSIFAIYSMTKTVVAVATLLLVEDGKLALDTPIARYLPEFTNMQVGGTQAPASRPARRPITVRHLLTHTSGFGGAKDMPEQSANLKAYSESVSLLPLSTDPGERFHYDSANAEVASRLVEVASRMSFDAFVRKRIFAPLGMHDTAFSVPPEKRARVADMTSTDREGRLITMPAGSAKQPGDRLRPYFSGAGGLYSTAGDFARFCQMLLNGGQLDGTRILKRESVELMMANQLTSLDPPVSQYGEGFGLGGYVALDVPGRERPGSVGQFGWSGAASTYYAIDRREQLFAILLMQHLPQGFARDPPKISFRFYNLVYQSLVK